MCGVMEKVLDADSNEPYLASIKERGGEGGGGGHLKQAIQGGT